MVVEAQSLFQIDQYVFGLPVPMLLLEDHPHEGSGQ